MNEWTHGIRAPVECQYFDLNFRSALFFLVRRTTNKISKTIKNIRLRSFDGWDMCAGKKINDKILTYKSLAA
jgi:hypothetical protein